MNGLGAYICDDGSIPDGANCADGTDAVFYSDTTGIAVNTPVVAQAVGFSWTTILVVGLIAYFIWKGRG